MIEALSVLRDATCVFWTVTGSAAPAVLTTSDCAVSLTTSPRTVLLSRRVSTVARSSGSTFSSGKRDRARRTSRRAIVFPMVVKSGP